MNHGFLACLPLSVGVALYGLAFGLLAADAGFSMGQIALMGVMVFAGASQIIAVERLATDGVLLTALFTGSLLNLRYLVMLAAIAPTLNDAPWRYRLVAIHLTADENWALTLSSDYANRPSGYRFLIGAGLSIMIAWVAASTLGAWLGTHLPWLDHPALGFAFTAAFIAMAQRLWRGREDCLPWATAFVVTVGLQCIANSDTTTALLIGTMAGVLVAGLGRCTSATTSTSSECPPT